jgi:CspA family cold shock protein
MQMPAETNTQNALSCGERFISAAETITLDGGSLLMRAFERSLGPGQSAKEAILKHVTHTVLAHLMRQDPVIFRAIESGVMTFDEGIEKSLDNPAQSCVPPPIQAAESDTRKGGAMRGFVKFYKDPEGYGFIVPEGEPQPDVYIHRSALQWAGIPKLEPGQRVEFEMRLSLRNGKPSASNIKLLHNSEAA